MLKVRGCLPLSPECCDQRPPAPVLLLLIQVHLSSHLSVCLSVSSQPWYSFTVSLSLWEYGYVCTTWHVWRSENNLWKFTLFMWILGLEIKLEGLAANAFIFWAILLAPFLSFISQSSCALLIGMYILQNKMFHDSREANWPSTTSLPIENNRSKKGTFSYHLTWQQVR